MPDPDVFEQSLAHAPDVARLRGPRVALGPWQPDDRPHFAALNADPETMRWFPSVLERQQSDALADSIEAALARRGWGWWAARQEDGEFIGFVGLNVPRFEAPFMPAVEIGWRLARAHWNRGYASEAATLALDYAFGSLALAEVVAFTTISNLRSRRVMERLHMRHDPADDFDHPALADGHPLRRHVLYRIGRADHFNLFNERTRRKDAP